MRLCIVLLLSFFCIRPVYAAEQKDFTPLIEAVTKAGTSPYAIETFILKNGDVNAVDDRGRSVLMLASMYHPDPLVHYLLIQGGAKINEQTRDSGKTALFFAVQYNPNPDVISLLLNYGADQNIQDVFGRTAYDYAERNPKLKGSLVLSLFHKHHETSEEDEASSVSAISR